MNARARSTQVPVAQLDRASASEAEGYRFDPYRERLKACLSPGFSRRLLAGFAAIAIATGSCGGAPADPPKNWTAAQDHQDMMDQLGIKALRPGPSGNE